MKPIDGQMYDYVFIGMGASNSLILLRMIREDMVTGKNIAIIDSSPKNQNDKTYCFWAAAEDSILKDLAPLIRYKYTRIKVSDYDTESIETQPYCCIRSIDLYNYIHKIAADHAIPFYPHSVFSIESDNTHYTLLTDNDAIRGKYIFDSRPPILDTIQKKDILLNQSFYGLHVLLKKDISDVETFEMMNFQVEQDKFTQFVYLLPYSKTEALIEFTRFGSEIMSSEYGKRVLHEYITHHYGSYEILAEEKGCIPMTTIQIEKSAWEGVLNTGARANLIKPSTGYGFKNMYNFAAYTVKQIKNSGMKNLNLIELPKNRRFAFYDHLLLIILLKWPHLGKPIFESLFKKQTIRKVLLFLDEKTTLRNDVHIFSSLPIIPFLKALMVYVSQRLSGRFGLFLLCALAYCLITGVQPEFALLSGYIILIAGMLMVGLPHGAVDYLLIDSNKSSTFIFIAKYVVIIFAYYFLWQFLPALSIIVFIIYSAFHFGESELEEMGVLTNLSVKSVLSFITGLCILLFIIASHSEQSIATVAQIHGLEFLLKYSNYLYESQFYLMLGSIGILSLLACVFWKKSLFFMLCILIAGIKIPLLLAFGSYFIFQHSTNAWKHIKDKLRFSNTNLLKKAYPFTLGAVVLFVLFVILTSFHQTEKMAILKSQFFVFLACISLPHVLVMHTFYKN